MSGDSCWINTNIQKPTWEDTLQVFVSLFQVIGKVGLLIVTLVLNLSLHHTPTCRDSWPLNNNRQRLLVTIQWSPETAGDYTLTFGDIFDCTPIWGDSWWLYTNMWRPLVNLHWHVETPGNHTTTSRDSWWLYPNMWRQLANIHQHPETADDYTPLSQDSWWLHTEIQRQLVTIHQHA